MNRVVPAVFLLICSALVASAQPPAFGRKDIRVTTTLANSSEILTPRVQVFSEPDGSGMIAVGLTNDSAHDVDLLEASVEIPWVAPDRDRFRVAAGATATGRWPPMLVIDPATDRTEPVSGMYLLARRADGYALAGFVSWRTFWSKLHYHAGRIVMTADGESRRIRAGETVALEKIRLAAGADWQKLLFDYAGAIARELHLVPKPARHFVGWSTWDYYGRGWRVADVRANLDALQRLVPGANLVQIDGGWWQERGDFAAVRDDLGPDGMKRLATEIRARGLAAGIHLDGMRASVRSAVAREHPKFFLHDERGAWIVETKGAGGDGPYVFFDYSHPGACAYMREALRRLRREWGYDYIKIDYLRAGIAEDIRQHVFAGNPARAIVPFDRGLTSVERFHRAMAAFREGMGDDAFFLGCSTPFGPTFGHVDALRTGPDINPKFTSYRLDCEANGGNFFLHGALAQIDADYQVVRAEEDQDERLSKEPAKDGGHLALNEAEMWTDYVALFGGTKLASDNLAILRDERKALVRFAAEQPACSRFVPLDTWEHARTRDDACHVFVGAAGRQVYLVFFNWSDSARIYEASGAAAATIRAPELFRGEAEVQPADRGVRVVVAARHAALFRLPAGTDFDSARALRIEQTPEPVVTQ